VLRRYQRRHETTNEIEKKINEDAIRDLIVNRARAVRTKNLDGILAHHSSEILMFDVPPPLQSKGIDAYQKKTGIFFFPGLVISASLTSTR
jgi:ketosteroid isomerase-like protein